MDQGSQALSNHYKNCYNTGNSVRTTVNLLLWFFQTDIFAAIAQLVERFHGKEEVSGSNPDRGSKLEEIRKLSPAEAIFSLLAQRAQAKEPSLSYTGYMRLKTVTWNIGGGKHLRDGEARY